MIKVAFICVHNSCRSQIAEALGWPLASDAFERAILQELKQNHDQSGCRTANEAALRD